jgi:uncharacterized protein YwgA
VRKEKSFINDSLLILASLFYNNEPVKGRTRFQKMIFLLKEKYDVPFTFKFKPYYYGPYSEEISDVLALLTALKFMEEKTEYLGMGVTRYNYQLTDKGKNHVCIFRENAAESDLIVIGKLQEDIAKINEMQTIELISKAKALMASSGK